MPAMDNSDELENVGPNPLALMRNRIKGLVSDFVEEADVDEDGDLRVVFHGSIVHIRTLHLANSVAATVGASIAMGLRPSETLFRYVATRSLGYHFGAVFARVRPDTLVDVTFRQTMMLDGLTDDALRDTVVAFIETVPELTVDIHQLFTPDRSGL